MSKQKVVKRANFLSGVIEVPGDKSISHRAVMLSSIADGESCITGFLKSEDCLSTVDAMRELGVDIDVLGTEVRVKGKGCYFNKPNAPIYCGNSGTTMRLISGLLAGQPFNTVLTGDESLTKRPMKRIKKPLEEMGAVIQLTGEKGTAPIKITGSKDLKAIKYELPVASAQVKSAILLAGLFAGGKTIVVEPAKTRDHTELMLKALGVDIQVDEMTISINGKSVIRPYNWVVPGDFSSAAFWIVAASIIKDSDVTIKNVCLNPRRTALISVLKRMGVDINVSVDEASGCFEPMGTIRVRYSHLKGTQISGSEIPNLIDEIPILAVACALAEGDSEIKDAYELRVKESDRIATICKNLDNLGVKIEEREDGMKITGCKRIEGGTVVDSFGDHRIAMSMAIISLVAEGNIKINNTSCIDTSYPQFWRDLSKLTGASNE